MPKRTWPLPFRYGSDPDLNKTMAQKRLALVFAAALFVGNGVEASNCALRNPQRQIYELFPEATNYRTVSGNVDIAAKRRIEAQIGRELEFSDLGKSTVCIVLKENVPIGFVHARAEVGVRGTTELVWALDLNMRVLQTRVQRSRERHADVLRSEAFSRLLVGRDWLSLRDLLDTETLALEADSLELPEHSHALAAVAVYSGVKTTVILECGFANIVWTARVEGHVARFFPDAKDITVPPRAVDEATRTRAQEWLGWAPVEVDPDSVKVVRAVGKAGESLGLLVHAHWRRSDPIELWIALQPDGHLDEVLSWDEGEAHEDLAALQGLSMDELRDRKEPAARFVAEVLALLRSGGVGLD